MTIYSVVLSGGSGTRLWPLSRSMWPKQFVHLIKNQEYTLFQSAVLRLDQDPAFAAPTIVCNNNHRFIIIDQLEECGVQAGKIILEPCGRNTGPAVTTAALALAEEDPDGVMIVMPSDHIVADENAFIDAVKMAIDVAQTGQLTLFGITPTEPDTGYGYIRRGDAIEGTQAFRVKSFFEKPDASKAKVLIESGEHYWNSGIFILPIKEYLAEVERLQPELLYACESSWQGAREDLGFLRLQESAFSAAPDISIDVAILEKTSNAAVVPFVAGWNDVGSWSTVSELIDKDDNGNSILGEAIVHNTANCLIHAQRRLVVGLGVEDLVIIDTPDALLVSAKDEAQNVPKIVEGLREQGRSESELHVRNFRPWGFFESLNIGPHFQVKKLHIKPGGIVSLQRHQHRNEHWVVVVGTAQITHGDKQFLLNENESTYIPATDWHRIGNPGSAPLEIIEIQTGTYLGEDDIERADDIYDRLTENL